MQPRLFPGTPAPALVVETLRHGRFDLAAAPPAGGILLVFHRGAQCKWTRRALKELDDRIGDFAIRGLEVVAVSTDELPKTAELQEKMQLIRLPLGHSVDAREIAARWGLYLSAGTDEGAEPLQFEPAQVWVKADGTVGLCAVQSAPNLWPDATGLLRAIDGCLRNPALGAVSAAPEPV